MVANLQTIERVIGHRFTQILQIFIPICFNLRDLCPKKEILWLKANTLN